MARARFAMLRHRKPAQRFLANDKGYIPLHDVARDVRGVVLPLSGLIAVLPRGRLGLAHWVLS